MLCHGPLSGAETSEAQAERSSNGWWAYHGDERPTEPPINKGKELGDNI